MARGLMKSIDRIGIFACCCLLLSWAAMPSRLMAQIQVTSSTPSAAPQGTVNLNVTIGGSGFKKGATSAFYVTGTTDPGGVTVNSTTFIGSTQLTANINVAGNADISTFDTVVKNPDGRTGKGSHSLSVTPQGTPVGCTTLGTPSAFTLVTTLNYVNASGAPRYSGGFGSTIRIRPVTLTSGGQSRMVLVAAVGSNGSGKMEFSILDPATGQVLDNTVVVGTQVQPHITVVFDPKATIGIGAIAAGDVNADGIPDFVAGSKGHNIAYLFVGSMNTNGILSYNLVTLNPPASNPGQFGSAVAMGNLDGVAGDEVVVGAAGGGTGHSLKPGNAFVYHFNGTDLDLIGTVNSPNTTASGFGFSVAIGDVTGDGAPDLIVVGPGAVYVFPSPLSSTFSYDLTAGANQVATGNFSSATATDVVAALSSGAVAVFAGPITSNRTSPTFTFPAYSGLSTTGWATGFDAADIDGDALGGVDTLVGVPNANNSTSCKVNVGAAELYFSNPSNPSQPTLYVFQPPVLDSNTSLFGWGVGTVPATAGNPPLLLVGETGHTLGGVGNAGQAYVYKKN